MAAAFKSETEFVAWLSRTNPASSGGLRLGIGDDAALIRPARGRDLILTADLSIEGVHFSETIQPPESVGHRALARSLSDIAAMGGTPRYALVALALSEKTDRKWTERFYRGFFRLARRFEVALIGGDTSVKCGRVVVDVTVVGDVPGGAALVRSGARPGDSIFVAGTLGLAAAGLRTLRSGSTPGRSSAVRAFLFPEPQCRLGEFLSMNRLATAAIDLSDGLSLDLARLLRASGVSARIHADSAPAPGLRGKRRRSRKQALSFALSGGDDYKLLFTVSPRQISCVPEKFENIRLFRIGEVCDGSAGEVWIEEDGRVRQLRETGYDHFRRV